MLIWIHYKLPSFFLFLYNFFNDPPRRVPFIVNNRIALLWNCNVNRFEFTIVIRISNQFEGSENFCVVFFSVEDQRSLRFWFDLASCFPSYVFLLDFDSQNAEFHRPTVYAISRKALPVNTMMLPAISLTFTTTTTTTTTTTNNNNNNNIINCNNYSNCNNSRKPAANRTPMRKCAVLTFQVIPTWFFGGLARYCTSSILECTFRSYFWTSSCWSGLTRLTSCSEHDKDNCY